MSDQHDPNQDVLARRSSTYADKHAASWELRFNRPDKPMSTKALVYELTQALADQVPLRLHQAPEHVDAGGAPDMTPQFMAYLDGKPMDSTEREPRKDSKGRDLVPSGTYRKPVHAALESMKRGGGKHAWWASIAERIILGSQAPSLAAMAEGSHQYEAGRTANEALSELYRRLTPDRMALHSGRAAA